MKGAETRSFTFKTGSSGVWTIWGSITIRPAAIRTRIVGWFILSKATNSKDSPTQAEKPTMTRTVRYHPVVSIRGRNVYYVFGRYPKEPDGYQYPVLDLVLCHGSFLNADNDYVHENKSFRGFGTYGDVLLRDRKMYVCPTPFALAEGTAHRRTLILPSDHLVDDDLLELGTVARREVDQMIVAYSFDLRTNQLETTNVLNPNAGRKHVFKVYRVKGDPADPVSLRESGRIPDTVTPDDEEEDEDDGERN